MSDNTQTNADLDALLDATLDDLADIPEFKPFPAGAHRCTLNLESKVVNNIPCVEAKLTAIETMELNDPTQEPCKAGDNTNVLFMLKKKDGTANELGQGQLKAVLLPLAQALGTSTNRETIEKANGIEVLVVTNIREDKKNAKTYTGIANIQVL